MLGPMSLLKRTFLSVPVFALALFAPPSNLTAGSIEQTPPSVEAICRELGIQMVNFTARFEEPVYAVFKLEILPKSGGKASICRHAITVPLREHTFSLSMTDLAHLHQKLGIPKSAVEEDARDAVEYSLAHPAQGFVFREKSPFGPMEVGTALKQWTCKQTDEVIQLGKTYSLFIQAGPYAKGNPPPKSILADYAKAPAYIYFGVTFSKEMPEETAAPDAKGQLELKASPGAK
jgi:hypothetical protein